MEAERDFGPRGPQAPQRAAAKLRYPGEAAATTDAVVIGGGPAGYTAAIALAQGGAAVRLIEAGGLGGTCVHRGCIPTKALLESARRARELAGAADFGLRLPGAAEVDWAAVRRRQDRVVAGLAGGLGQLLRGSGVAVLGARARLVPPASAGAAPGVLLLDAAGGEGDVLRPDAVVLAPGSRPARPALPGADLPGVSLSDDLLAAALRPRRLVVIGGGAVGCEFASAHADLGAEVAVLEALPHLLPPADADVARRLEAAFRRRGIRVATGVAVRALERAAAGLIVRAREASGAALDLPADAVLLATGRRPATEGMGLEEAGIALAPGGAIPVDAHQRVPGVAGVWAVGDATGPPMLAHAGMAAALAAAADMLGRPAPPRGPVPHPVYTHPEVAWVGASEATPGASAARVPFGALGRAHAAGDTEGLCKVVADAAGRIIGVHIFGASATELIAAGVLAVSHGLRLEQVAEATWPHPTLSEGLGEAAALLLGRPHHVLRAARRPGPGGEGAAP